MKPRPIELLAPARDAHVAIEAIKHGADAVYIGGPSHGARSAATNYIADIAGVVDYAHRFNARVYVTLNTLVYDDEISQVEDTVGQLYKIGVDALIVQDLGLLEMDLPPIQLHASTQCDIRTPEKARFLQDVGFSQLVLPRELSLEEIAEIRSATDVPLESFIHGALCVSYSGDCQAGVVAMGRSANRGECPQLCRLRYDLIDGSDNVLVSGKHLLSLKDLNRSGNIAEMLEAGVSSLKIEGRLKDAAYVKNAVVAYRSILDKIIASNPDRYCRLSSGTSEVSFAPELSKGFNRSFTPFFIKGVKNVGSIASIETPKMVGERVGRIVKVDGKRLEARLTAELHNGDGLSYFKADGSFGGFRVNRVSGNQLFTAEKIPVMPGTVIYRNFDKQWCDKLEQDTATRRIAVEMTIKNVDKERIALEIRCERGNSVSKVIDVEYVAAKTPQEAARQKILSKTGDTIYRVEKIVDTLGDRFVPASLMAQLRRDTLELLDRVQAMRFNRSTRREALTTAVYPDSVLSYHDNVANHLAEKFYRLHGVVEIQPALEVKLPEGELQVMETKYCIRREFGKCLKTKTGRQWQGPLYLRNESDRCYRLDFDCRVCKMRVVTERR